MNSIQDLNTGWQKKTLSQHPNTGVPCHFRRMSLEHRIGKRSFRWPTPHGGASWRTRHPNQNWIMLQHLTAALFLPHWQHG